MQLLNTHKPVVETLGSAVGVLGADDDSVRINDGEIDGLEVYGVDVGDKVGDSTGRVVGQSDTNSTSPK